MLLDSLIIWYRFSSWGLINKYWYVEWLLTYILILTIFLFFVLIWGFKKILLIGLGLITIGYFSILLFFSYFGFTSANKKFYEKLENPHESRCYLTREVGIDLGAMSEEVNYLSYKCYHGDFWVTDSNDLHLVVASIYDWVDDQKCRNMNCKLYMVDDIFWEDDNVIIVELDSQRKGFFNAQTGEQIMPHEYYKKNPEIFTLEEKILLKVGDKIKDFYGDNYYLEIDEGLSLKDRYWFVIVYNGVKGNVVGGFLIGSDYNNMIEFEAYSSEYFSNRLIDKNDYSKDFVIDIIKDTMIYEKIFMDNDRLTLGDPVEHPTKFSIRVYNKVETIDGKFVENLLTLFFLDKQNVEIYIKPTNFEARNYIFKVK